MATTCAATAAEAAACLLRAGAPHGAQLLDADAAVPVLTAWRGDNFSTPIAACRVPAILDGTETTALWKSAARWAHDVEFLASLLPDGALREVNVAESDDAIELLASSFSEAAAAAVDAATARATSEPAGEIEATVPASALGRGEARLSFARWLGYSDLSALQAAVSPQQPLHVVEPGDDAAAPGAERRYLRFATAGALSNLHYDEYHNFYVQLHGAKIFSLAPPTAWAAVRSFPKNNDRFRQSPSRALPFWSAEDRAAAGIQTVRVDAGQLLYIPPYHWHQTLTLGASGDHTCAVNVWSPSAEAAASARAAAHVDAPALLRAGAPSALGALAHFARRLLVSDSGLPTFGALHAAQHAHLRATRRAAKAKGTDAACAAAAAAEAALPADVAAALAASAEKVGGALRELPEGVRDLAAADVLMDVAEHVGAAAGVGAVLALLCVNRTI